jgi:hypothetical protein
MLTVTCHSAVSESNRSAQIETLPSDDEITRRVMQIRSKWSLSERIRRRREAEQRFADLVDSLMGPAA